MLQLAVTLAASVAVREGQAAVCLDIDGVISFAGDAVPVQAENHTVDRGPCTRELNVLRQIVVARRFDCRQVGNAVPVSLFCMGTV